MERVPHTRFFSVELMCGHSIDRHDARARPEASCRHGQKCSAEPSESLRVADVCDHGRDRIEAALSVELISDHAVTRFGLRAHPDVVSFAEVLRSRD